MAVSFGAVVQRLNRRRDRVLAVAAVVGARSGDGWFRPLDLRNMFERLRLPRPGNVNEDLARLERDEFVVRHTRQPLWAVTPHGEEAVHELIGAVDPAEVEAELHSDGGAPLAGIEHPLVPPELAPIRFQPAISRILDVSPFERNVFLMTRFPPAGAGIEHPLVRAISEIRRVTADVGLTLHVASDRQADDQLLGNVAAHMWASKYGIALLEALEGDGAERQLNDNVLIEVGAMLMSGRRCGLLKDPGSPRLPSDFIAEIYKEVEIAEPAAVAEATAGWIRDDLGL